MSMNIGPMIRAMMGDAQPADAKSLELRIGQIVRGVLLELMDNQEALVNINGVHVRAKLAADMPLGRSTLLQVQPGGAGGLIALKPLADLLEGMPEEGLKDVLKTFGMPEQKWAMELLRGLKRDGYPIGKETAAHFNTAMAMKPPGVEAESWLNAADVAFRRGLKPTETTLSSLRQALYGQPVHEELANLRSALDSWLGGAKPPSPETAALGQRLQALLAQGASILSEGEAMLTGDPRASTAKPEAAITPQAGTTAPPQTGGEAARTAANASPQAGGESGAARAAVPQAQSLAGQAAQTPAQTSATPANAAQPEASRPAASVPAAPAPVAEERAAAANRPAAADGAAADGRRSEGRADATASPASAPKPEAAWIGRFLQWLGVGHERQLLHAAEARLPGGGDAGPGAGAAHTPGGAEASGQEARPSAETLKGALLALASRDDVPPALREAAQTLAGQVTGQQLLLSSDRGMAAPFSHMTLFVPMKGADGDTTATVHVQTRRGRKGEWDVNNCHLLFDLRMRHLGDTIVDVQVVDRIVSLKLLSDFPGMTELLDNAREELVEGMSSSGFQLLSLSAAPLPDWKNGSAASALSAEGANRAAMASAYAAKPYKGVDYRA
ncbi:hypothetical protein [Cohnella terricola]|uniref:Flagellar hook-length control protein FliK n=1 Tax=Cohnella terricola TaxID=1289167 RepID=A0A559JCU1_9BACL|nr:hypothetical protein [Cohnella terricola]TVX97686.1 hypothetical protein FPZ45_18115 [Cohnella terricola]